MKRHVSTNSKTPLLATIIYHVHVSILLFCPNLHVSTEVQELASLFAGRFNAVVVCLGESHFLFLFVR